MAPKSSIIFLVGLASICSAEASSQCWKSVYNETVAVFNSAPFTYSLELETATVCQSWCGDISKCQAWVYVDHANHCDLYRTSPLSLSDNSGFTFGGCEPTNSTQPIPTTSWNPVPSASSTPVQSTDGFSVSSKFYIGINVHEHPANVRVSFPP